jgi:hypothetical protein
MQFGKRHLNLLFLMGMLIASAACTHLREEWCVSPGSMAETEYDNQFGPHKEQLQVGSNWGIRPQDAADFSCMGFCGPGCSYRDKHEIWSKGCLAHDVCSYRSNSKRFLFDPDCGDEAVFATWQFLVLAATGGCKAPAAP